MATLHRLRRHPIPMTCHFEHSLVLAWAVPAEMLQSIVPPGLTVDTYDDRWGFLAVAVVQTRDLRPAFLPGFVGRRDALSGYRVFVRHRDRSGRVRRGLHILRSDTDRRTMELGGNLLTHYNYRLARIDIATARAGETDEEQLTVRIDAPHHEADLHVVAHLGAEPAPLPVSSPFASALDARRFAGPLPWTFDHEPETDSIVMIHGRRSAWRPQPVAVDVETCTFLEQGPFAGVDARLANAFHVSDIDYGWERGIRVPVTDRAS